MDWNGGYHLELINWFRKIAMLQNLTKDHYYGDVLKLANDKEFGAGGMEDMELLPP